MGMSEDPKPYKIISDLPGPSEEEKWRRAYSAAYRRTLENQERIRILEARLKDLEDLFRNFIQRSEN